MDSPKNSKFEFLNSRIGDLNDHLEEIMDQTEQGITEKCRICCSLITAKFNENVIQNQI